jgi:hypothetical protein
VGFGDGWAFRRVQYSAGPNDLRVDRALALAAPQREVLGMLFLLSWSVFKSSGQIGKHAEI